MEISTSDDLGICVLNLPIVLEKIKNLIPRD